MGFLKLLGRMFLSFFVALCILVFISTILAPLGIEFGEEPDVPTMLLILVTTIVVYIVITKFIKVSERDKKEYNARIRAAIINPLTTQQCELESKAKELLKKYENTTEFVKYRDAINNALDMIDQHNCNMVVIGTNYYDYDPDDSRFSVEKREGIYFATLTSNRSEVYSGFVKINRPSSIPEDTIENGSIKALMLKNRYPNRYVYGRPQNIHRDYWNTMYGDFVFMTSGLLDLYIKDYHEEDEKKRVKKMEEKKKKEEQYKRERNRNIPM